MSEGAVTRLEPRAGIAEAAAPHGVSDPKIRRLVRSGRVRAEMVEVGGRAGAKLMVWTDDVAAALAEEAAAGGGQRTGAATAARAGRQGPPAAALASPAVPAGELRDLLAGLAVMLDDRAATREASAVERLAEAEHRAGSAGGEAAALREQRDAALAEAAGLRRQLGESRQAMAVARLRLEQRGVFGRRWASSVFGPTADALRVAQDGWRLTRHT
jgi:hypothetical protein